MRKTRRNRRVKKHSRKMRGGLFKKLAISLGGLLDRKKKTSDKHC